VRGSRSGLLRGLLCYCANQIPVWRAFYRRIIRSSAVKVSADVVTLTLGLTLAALVCRWQSAASRSQPRCTSSRRCSRSTPSAPKVTWRRSSLNRVTSGSFKSILAATQWAPVVATWWRVANLMGGCGLGRYIARSWPRLRAHCRGRWSFT